MVLDQQVHFRSMVMLQVISIIFICAVFIFAWCLCRAAALSDKEMEESIRKMVRDAKKEDE